VNGEEHSSQESGNESPTKAKEIAFSKNQLNMPHNRNQNLSPVERFGIKFSQVRQLKIDTEDEKENEKRKEKAKQADILKEKN
jgi:hypothetical protein